MQKKKEHYVCEARTRIERVSSSQMRLQIDEEERASSSVLNQSGALPTELVISKKLNPKW